MIWPDVFFQAVWRLLASALLSYCLLAPHRAWATSDCSCRPDTEVGACAQNSKAPTLPAQCPEWWQSLQQQGLVRDLALSEHSDYSPVLAEQLIAYQTEPQRQVPAVQADDVALMQQMLKRNYRSATAKEPGLLDQLAQWWDSLFATEGSGNSSDFLSRWLPGKVFARLLFWAVLGLFMALVFVYAWRELKPLLAAKRTQDWQKQAHQQRLAKALNKWPPNVAGLSPEQALASLFTALVEIQTARRMLPDIPGLTHFELAQRYLHQPSKDQFHQLCQAAAAALFGAQVIEPALLAQFIEQANQILAQMGRPTQPEMAQPMASRPEPAHA